VISSFSNLEEAREWLVDNIKGMGYKEASHFLRNIGLGEEFAILDRHILKNLQLLGIIEEVPASLSRKRYFEIEKKMVRFSDRINIPMAHLDLLLWYKETGEVFK
jgi:N-glycosylase/DNA lyase